MDVELNNFFIYLNTYFVTKFQLNTLVVIIFFDACDNFGKQVIHGVREDI
jgi:hypothetical protein